MRVPAAPNVLCVPLAVLSMTACSIAARPCISPGDCKAGTECLANCCSTPGGSPVAQDTARVELLPAEMCVVTASHRRASLPAAVVLGSRSVGGVSLYLRFATSVPRRARVERAWLLLEPIRGAAPSSERVSVDVWRVAGPWSPSTLDWLGQPPAGSPRGEGLARTDPHQTLRIDVTEVVRYLRDHPEYDHGMVLKSNADAPRGAAFSTGAISGRMPVLELYFGPG